MLRKQNRKKIGFSVFFYIPKDIFLVSSVILWLSCSQLRLPVSGSSWSSMPSTHLIHPAADTQGSTTPKMIKSGHPQPPSAADTAKYFVLPLEASGVHAWQCSGQPMHRWVFQYLHMKKKSQGLVCIKSRVLSCFKICWFSCEYS